jgi:Fe-S cluster assembly protein SufD
MMTNTAMPHVPTSLLAAMDACENRFAGGVSPVRASAKERFLAQGIPNRRDEEWKYTSLKPLSDPAFQFADAADAIDQAILDANLSPTDLPLVFVNGVFAPAYSPLDRLPAGLSVEPLEAHQTGSLFDDRTALGFGENPMRDLNLATSSQGVVIRVSKDAVVESPIHLLHVVTKSENLSSLRHLIQVERGAQAELVESHVQTESVTALTLCGLDIVVKENAVLRHIRDQVMTGEGLHVSTIDAVVSAHGTYDTFGLAQGGRLIRNDINVAIVGEGAHTTLDGLYLVDGHSVIDNHTTIDHQVPHATSQQLYKGILDGEGRGVFNGKVLVRKDAQQTQAFQTNKNLLRSEKAEIDTKPELKIDADDVKCSHGAAIGRLDLNEIFYLQSRGISREKAEVILAAAFAGEVVMRITDEKARQRIQSRCASYFAGSHHGS